MTARPPELQIEGAIIRTSYGTGGRVIEVQGPYPWTIVYEDLRPGLRDRKRWINEVHVVDGRIYAYPWSDEIFVMEPAEMQQLSLF